MSGQAAAEVSEGAGAVEEVDYLEEGGPGIPDISGAPLVPPPRAAQEAEPPPPGWDQETIETFLRGTGSGIHMLIGQAERDWLLLEEDLRRIAPPLTRICNRWEPALRLSPLADPLLVAHGFALYGWRSALEAKRAQRDAEEAASTGPGYEEEPPGAAVAAAGSVNGVPEAYFPQRSET
jgi:hypothetical protein